MANSIAFLTSLFTLVSSKNFLSKMVLILTQYTPGRHEDVEVIVKAAHEHNVVIIPYGGGTSVSCALLCPENETRMIVSLDMHEMDKIKWVDRTNMTACIEAGIVGRVRIRKYIFNA